MEPLRHTVETLIRLVQAEILANAVLVSPDDAFEVTRTPSLILQGPSLTENLGRRAMGPYVSRSIPDLTFTARNPPRLYHLDFDLIATTARETDLLDLQEKTGRFYQLHRVIEVPNFARLNLTEAAPLGGLRRVNLSNLRQSSGRLRIEDFPIWDGVVTTGPLIRDRIFQYHGDLTEDRQHGPPADGGTP